MWYPIKPTFIDNLYEYWAIHFCSVLEFLHYHKQMSEKALDLHTYPTWSLNDLRGHLPVNYYGSKDVFNKMRNWAFQYFLVKYLNTNLAFYIVDEIIDRINSIHKRYIINDFTNYEFILSGRDSKLSDNIKMGFTFNRCIPFNFYDKNIQNSIDNSDIILVLTDQFGFKTAVFCEVEFVANKIFGGNYWNKKNHSIVSFSVENN